MAALVAVLLDSGASAQPAPAIPTPAVKQPEVIVTGKKPRKRCETITKTGSILPSRICRTEEEWEAERAASLVALGRMQDDQQNRSNAQMHKEMGRN